MTYADQELEREIDRAYEKMIFAHGESATEAALTELVTLVRRRSPYQARRLEHERRTGRVWK